ncbi:MAG: hypothetical protein HY684_01600 [Chloroflexi bacterium]|nr:hypothetical protein [Chloroflexota bacterium]
MLTIVNEPHILSLMVRKEKQALFGARVEDAGKGRPGGDCPPRRKALAEWLHRRYPSLPLEEDRSLEASLALGRGMKARGMSWAEIGEEVERRFEVKLDKDQLKAFLR